MQAGLLIDTTRCIGCNACAEACKEANGLPGEIDPQLTCRTWTRVRDVKGTYVRQLCMHCEKPSCASVCPVGALYKSEKGPVAYDESKCIGCRYCMAACPFQIPKYEWDKALPRVQKCIGCLGRLEKGQIPACAAACPAEATVAGDREALLAEAKRRLREKPASYVDRIYGETEVGGTNTLFLAAVPFEELGFPVQLPHDPMPNLTWAALSKIPNVVSIGGLSLLGMWWIIRRRMEIERLDVERAEASRSHAPRVAGRNLPMVAGQGKQANPEPVARPGEERQARKGGAS
jgi:formate dehydrogenase iron-sulfur subunit